MELRHLRYFVQVAVARSGSICQSIKMETVLPSMADPRVEETQLRGRTNSPCHCFARALKAQRSLKTMDVRSVCITVKRQGTP